MAISIFRRFGLVPFYAPFIPELVQPVMEGESQIDGLAVYHISGLQPPSETPGEQEEVFYSVIAYDLYIGKEDMLLKRLRINAEMRIPTPEETIIQTTVYDYFDYNAPVHISLPPVDPCNRSTGPGRWLDCHRLSQRVYWLGERLGVSDAPDLALDGAWINYTDESRTIKKDSRLTIVYAGENPSSGPGSVYLEQWYRPAWEEYLSGFAGYDPELVPQGGPVNWWQHPCVEEEVYEELNGAEVHLFKARLPSLIYIYPMTAEEVSQCLQEPVGAVGAHAYFKETVVEFSVQDSVTPAGPPATPQVLVPGATRPVQAQAYPELVIRSRNPYNNVETVKLIAASLAPYEKP